MQVSCQRDALLEACQIVGAATAARSVKPILSHVKVVAADDGNMTDALTLMATDLEVGIRFDLRGVKVARPGSAVIPVTRLISILREAHDAEVTLTAGPETTTVRLASGRFELPSADPAEFPEIPGVPEVGAEDTLGYHEITAGSLRQMIRRTAFSVAKRESTRFAVTGLLWEVEAGDVDGVANGGRCRLVGTDTRRLALCEAAATVVRPRFVPEGAPPGKPPSHLIPTKAIQLLERNLTDDGEIVRVVLKPNEALFQTEKATIHTRLLEGLFPPYRNIIPGGWGKDAPANPKVAPVKLTLATGELFTAIRQAAIMADDETRRVDFHFQPEKLTLRARGAETGSGEVVMPLPDYTGPELSIAFEPSILTDMLRAIENEPSANLEMTDKVKPAVFRVADSYLYLVMPLSDGR